MNIQVPKPTITPITKPFWDSVEEKKLTLQYCDQCHKAIFYPRAHCPHCFHDQLTWKEVSGKGNLKTWSIIHRAGHPAWQERTPYAVGVVQLVEGPSMLTHLLIDPGQLSYQMEVQVQFEVIDDQTLPFFVKKEVTS